MADGFSPLDDWIRLRGGREDERGGEHLDVGVLGQGEAANRLGGIQRERVHGDAEPPGLAIPVRLNAEDRLTGCSPTTCGSRP